MKGVFVHLAEYSSCVKLDRRWIAFLWGMLAAKGSGAVWAHWKGR